MTDVPKKYTLVRLDDGIKPKAVLTMNPQGDMITDSGLVAENGEIHAASGSINLGLQTMSSAGEQVIWRNSHSQVRYAPPWHVIDDTNPGGSKDRYYGKLQKVTRQAIDVDVLESPIFRVHIPEDEVVFRLELDFPEARDNVVIYIEQDELEMWRDIRNVNAGPSTITLDIPITFYEGDYDVRITDINGAEDVKIKGDLQTNIPAYSVWMRPFTEHVLATQDFVKHYMNGYDPSELPDELKALLAKLRQDIDHNTNVSTTNKSKLVVNNDKIEGLINDINVLRPSLVSYITGSLDPNTHHLRVSLKAHDKTIVDTVEIDLSSLHGGGSSTPDTPDKPVIPEQKYRVYAGFSPVHNPTGQHLKIYEVFTKEVSSVKDLDVTLSRQDSSMAGHLWLWVPDELGAVKYVYLGMPDYWDTAKVSVDGNAGTLYISQRKTFAANVEFKVIQ